MKFACLLFSITQILCTFLARLLGFGTPIGEGATGGITPIVPADVFFAIWGLLFAGCVFYGVMQALPQTADARGFAASRPFATISFAATTLWDVAAQFGQPWMTPPILAFVAITGVIATRNLVSMLQPGLASWLAASGLAMFSGWVSFATFANFADSLKFYGVLSSQQIEITVCCALILAAGCTLAAVQRFYLHFWIYIVPPVWGLIGILVRNQLTDPEITVSVAIAGAVILGAVVSGIRRYAV